MTSTDEMDRLKCERIVNETWAKAREYYEELQEIIERGTIEDGRDEAILLIAANASLQKMTLDQMSDQDWLGK